MASKSNAYHIFFNAYLLSEKHVKPLILLEKLISVYPLTLQFLLIHYTGEQGVGILLDSNEGKRKRKEINLNMVDSSTGRR